MSLAYMARLYPDMLVCDMAETYSVLDWRVLPATLAATLANGREVRSPLAISPRAWQIVDSLVGVTMLVIAARLAFGRSNQKPISR